MSTITRRDTRIYSKSLNLGYLACAIVAAAGLASPSVAAPVPFGPTAYLQASDSPFGAFSFSYFYRETFEDHSLNTPGLSASPGGVTSVVFGPTIHDSVDADDGAINGSGLAGDSYFSGTGSVTLLFDATVLGTLPTHAGLVWTDGGFGATVTFQAFDGSNNLLGTIINSSHADSSNNGETAEDRFYGFSSDTGIARLVVSNTGGGIEIDHVQYGLVAELGEVPLPSAIMLFAGGLGALGLVARRRIRRA